MALLTSETLSQNMPRPLSESVTEDPKLEIFCHVYFSFFFLFLETSKSSFELKYSVSKKIITFTLKKKINFQGNLFYFILKSQSNVGRVKLPEQLPVSICTY